MKRFVSLLNIVLVLGLVMAGCATPTPTEARTEEPREEPTEASVTATSAPPTPTLEIPSDAQVEVGMGDAFLFAVTALEFPVDERLEEEEPENVEEPLYTREEFVGVVGAQLDLASQPFAFVANQLSLGAEEDPEHADLAWRLQEAFMNLFYGLGALGQTWSRYAEEGILFEEGQSHCEVADPAQWALNELADAFESSDMAAMEGNYAEVSPILRDAASQLDELCEALDRWMEAVQSGSAEDENAAAAEFADAVAVFRDSLNQIGIKLLEITAAGLGVELAGARPGTVRDLQLCSVGGALGSSPAAKPCPPPGYPDYVYGLKSEWVYETWTPKNHSRWRRITGLPIGEGGVWGRVMYYSVTTTTKYKVLCYASWMDRWLCLNGILVERGTDVRPRRTEKKTQLRTVPPWGARPEDCEPPPPGGVFPKYWHERRTWKDP